MTPLSRLSAPVPRLIELERLRSLAHQYESDPDRAGDAVRELAGVAGASGGARPKANVEDNGQLWIAKFTSREDRRAVERAEVATLKLASRCGLRVPEARLELARSDSPVALIRRFDRRGDIRIPYMSARAALDAHDTEGRYYTEIADIIRQISSKPLDDLHELWRRIVFTILVSNTDDHLKNHGFIYAGRRRWRLSPAFDINPAPMRQRVLQTGILEGEPFHASLTLALEAAGLFDFEQEDAKRTASKMAVLIDMEWRKALRAEGGIRRRDLKHSPVRFSTKPWNRPWPYSSRQQRDTHQFFPGAIDETHTPYSLLRSRGKPCQVRPPSVCRLLIRTTIPKSRCRLRRTLKPRETAPSVGRSYS